ncbi:hypothetical protein [Terrisporobacter hibernicus]|uniref:Uncharacterized protein n=1 Tax=Terrisporobacter hibernicus TaxID=2813371 RepID=A0AAX2ZG61_9FIRM|nr:hypothetical protein [Terrisporobacter hibernicus]UEL48294.1 hypothetical protein JW646_02240 [Terrisporobacter hibernicus]
MKIIAKGKLKREQIKNINEIEGGACGMVSNHENIENARKFESNLIGEYKILEYLNNYEPERHKIFIINQMDSNVKIKDNRVEFKSNLIIG